MWIPSQSASGTFAVAPTDLLTVSSRPTRQKEDCERRSWRTPQASAVRCIEALCNLESKVSAMCAARCLLSGTLVLGVHDLTVQNN